MSKKLYVLQDLCLLNKWETPLFFQRCCYGVTPIFSRRHYHNEAYEASYGKVKIICATSLF